MVVIWYVLMTQIWEKKWKTGSLDHFSMIWSNLTQPFGCESEVKTIKQISSNKSNSYKTKVKDATNMEMNELCYVLYKWQKLGDQTC